MTATDTIEAKTAQPLAMHWWRSQPNFGDAINPFVVAHVSGREVRHAAPRASDLFAIGSMLQLVKRKFQEPRPQLGPIHIWGTGLLHPVSGSKWMDNMEIAAVRGPVTAGLLNKPVTNFGDPGLLIDAVWPFEAERTDRIGIVPHHSGVHAPEVEALLASDPAYMLIDPADDPKTVCHQIASCAQVFASSLHGLIVADAYGVPNTWVRTNNQMTLKYLDYAMSVGRTDMRAPISWEDVPDAPFPGAISYNDGIARCRETLLDCFPATLKSGAS
ncbi:polysaccharide pyruvyl transferase family protein [Sulfitobacter sp. HNIBRBA3233]|uniref:polysaccharide pyruvyl transferase family protein n=1 Tax=Sulfitobacter marinivivus TaxID=3158558 RepID=UPI0032DEA234